MCLLVTQPEGTVWDEAFIAGVYKKNKDGLGVMYSKLNTLHYAKVVPKTFLDFTSFFAEYINGRACAWHARMQTHGHVDMTNCHPYEVLRGDYPLFLMHNGVLHTDNLEDQTKSDTYLYIKNYLRPILEHNPTWFKSPAFTELVSSHIGHGNKFVLLDAYGNQAIINEGEFVGYNGALLSNTYAWDTKGTKFDRKDHTWGRPYSVGSKWADDHDWFSGGKSTLWPASVSDAEYAEDVADASTYATEVFNALAKGDFPVSYARLRGDDIEQYYMRMGCGAAYELLDMIDDSEVSDADVMDEILHQS